MPPTPVRMAMINRTGYNKCWRACAEEGMLVHCWWECRLVQPLWKTVLWLLKKLRIELPYDPATPPPGIYLRNSKTFIHKVIGTHMVTAALFTVAKTWRQPQCPLTEDWMKKMGCTYTTE